MFFSTLMSRREVNVTSGTSSGRRRRLIGYSQITLLALIFTATAKLVGGYGFHIQSRHHHHRRLKVRLHAEPPPQTSSSSPEMQDQASSSSSSTMSITGWTPVMPDFTSLGPLITSSGAESNSTLIGLLQVAQAAMNPRSVTRSFSRQFSKRYLSKWEDKTGLKEIVEQTLADLVRVADTIDVHSHPRVAAFASRVCSQVEDLRQSHDAKVIFFFNESPETISEIPSLPSFPFKTTSLAAEGEESEEDGSYYGTDGRAENKARASLFGPRRVAAAGAVKKKQQFVRLFKNLLSLSRNTEYDDNDEEEEYYYEDEEGNPVSEEDIDWFQQPSEESLVRAPPAPLTSSGAGQSGVDRILAQVKKRMENKAQEERQNEEAVVKAGLRVEFERWQLLEASRYLSETLSRTRDIIGNALSSSGAEKAALEAMARVPTPLRGLFQDFESTLARGKLPRPVKLDFDALNSVINSVKIGHRPEDRFPQRDWRRSLDVLSTQSPISDPLLGDVNHPLYLHSSLLIATTPYNLALTPESEKDPVLLQRTALTASKALGVHPSRLKVYHVVSDKACAVVIAIPDRRTTYVTFRGTKDPVDVLTDINFLSATFTPLGWEKSSSEEEVSRSSPFEESEEKGTAVGFLPFLDPQAAQGQLELMTGTDDATGVLKVHGGFKVAFDSIKDRVTELLDGLEATENVVFVGHSMGGALAQLATVYYCELKARLVTFASPAIGNSAFCRLLDCCGQPYGGLRVWNDFDVVPSIAQLVGYKHAGVPIKLDVSKSAKEMFEEENVNPLKGLIDFLAPHVMFQLGPVCFVFPVLGWDLQSGGSAMRGKAPAAETAAAILPPELSPSSPLAVVASERNIQ